MPATSGGTKASAKRYAGADHSVAPDRPALIDIAVNPIAAATAASASHTVIQRTLPSGGPEIAAAPSADAPINIPPTPGTAVNELARSIASRMKRRFSAACAWIGSGAGAIDKNFIP